MQKVKVVVSLDTDNKNCWMHTSITPILDLTNKKVLEDGVVERIFTDLDKSFPEDGVTFEESLHCYNEWCDDGMDSDIFTFDAILDDGVYYIHPKV